MKNHESTVRLDGYTVLDLLGTGSFGSVYLAEHINLKVFRAVKCISKSQDVYGTAVREADILKNLRHPAIPIIYDINEDDEYVYIIEEYVQGESLANLISRKKRIEQDRLTQIALKLCDILEYLHSKGIYHHDIKPENIMICSNEVRLLDYGNAVKAGEVNPVKMGTKGYAAPEMYGTDKSGAGSDIYSLGVVMLAMATGERHPGALSEVKPKELRNIIRRCICHSPKERFKTPDDLSRTLIKKQKKFVSDVSLRIHVAGVTSHCGTTHCANAVARMLASKKFDTVLCEKNGSGGFFELLQEFANVKFKSGVYNCDGLDIVPEYYGCAEMDFIDDYEKVVKDYGVICNEIPKEFSDGDIICVVTGGREYEIRKLMKLLTDDHNPFGQCKDKMYVLINLVSARRYKQIVSRYGIPNPVRVPYEAEPGKTRKKDWLTL